MSEWQKIETAPKVGVPVLVVANCVPRHYGEETVQIGPTVYLALNENDADGWKLADGSGPIYLTNVTHWMPLPSPPHPLSEETK